MRPQSDQQVLFAPVGSDARIAIIDLAVPGGTVDPDRDINFSLVLDLVNKHKKILYIVII